MTKERVPIRLLKGLPSSQKNLMSSLIRTDNEIYFLKGRTRGIRGEGGCTKWSSR